MALEFDKELRDRYFDLWSRQNDLLWSRVKTLATLQAGLFAGWYVLQHDQEYFLAITLGIFGVVLSWFLKQVIVRDGKVRDHFRDKLLKTQPLLEWPPEAKGHLSGISSIIGTADAFMVANFFLTIVSIFYWGGRYYCH